MRKEDGDLRADDVTISVWPTRELGLLSDRTELESELKCGGLLAVVLGGRTEGRTGVPGRRTVLQERHHDYLWKWRWELWDGSKEKECQGA